MTPTEAGVRELCANTRETMHLLDNYQQFQLAGARIRNVVR